MLVKVAPGFLDIVHMCETFCHKDEFRWAAEYENVYYS